MLSCQRCKQTSNGPQAFLLTCRACSKTWHHRCHMPPIEDGDLVRRIRATNTGDTANSLSAWMCRRCKKSVMSSRESTVSSDSREGRKSLISSCSPAVTDITTSTSTASVASTVDVRVRQESHTAVDAQLLNKRSDLQEPTEAAPAKRIFSAKRTKPSAVNRPHVQPQSDSAQSRDGDVQMGDGTPATVTPQEKESSLPTTLSHQGTNARKLVSTVPATSSEDVEMRVEATPPSSSEPTSRATSQAPASDTQTIRPESVTEGAYEHVASPASARVRELWPADGTAIQPQVNQDAADEMDDDPEDLYGPFVERRIIRILPSLAEDLKDQQRRVAAEKEKRQASLAPGWTCAKQIHDPLRNEIPVEGRKRRKPTARRLGDNGLIVDELMGCFTIRDWIREHKT